MAIPSITNNSPSAGHIAWGAFNIQLYGVSYTVGAAFSDQRWVWWEYRNGSPILNAGPEVPSTLTDDDLVLFANKNGIGVRVQSTSFIDGELLVDGSIFSAALSTNLINSQHIVTAGLDAGVIKFGEMSGERIAVNTLSGDRILANSITASEIAAGAITAEKISTSAITADKISANALNGKTIVGGRLMTAATGERIDIGATGTTNPAGRISFYPEHVNADQSSPGFIESDASQMGPTADSMQIMIQSPGIVNAPVNKEATFTLSSDRYGTEYSTHALLNADKVVFQSSTNYPDQSIEFQQPVYVQHPVELYYYGGWKTVGTSGWPIFRSGWTPFNASAYPVEFKIDAANNLHIRGLVDTASGTPGSTVFVLPEGFRPATTVSYIQLYAHTNGQATMDVNTLGEVKVRNRTGPTTAGSFISLKALIPLS